MTHSIPDSSAVALTTDLGTVLITGDYKFDQTPVDGPPADVSRLAELGREGVLLLCGDSTNVDREGFSPSESVVGPHLEEVFARCEGRIVVTSFASNIHRVQQVLDAAARARPQGRARGALDAQERRHRAQPRTHRGPRGAARRGARDRRLRRRARRDHLHGLAGRAALGAAPDGPPRPSAGRAQARRHGRLLGDADTRQRARRQRDDRPPLPHRLRRDHDARGAGARLRARLRGRGQADAEPRQAALRDALPRRLQAPAAARAAGRSRRGAPERDLPGRQRRAAGHRRVRRALRRARAGRA